MHMAYDKYGLYDGYYFIQGHVYRWVGILICELSRHGKVLVSSFNGWDKKSQYGMANLKNEVMSVKSEVTDRTIKKLSLGVRAEDE